MSDIKNAGMIPSKYLCGFISATIKTVQGEFEQYTPLEYLDKALCASALTMLTSFAEYKRVTEENSEARAILMEYLIDREVIRVSSMMIAHLNQYERKVGEIIEQDEKMIAEDVIRNEICDCCGEFESPIAGAIMWIAEALPGVIEYFFLGCNDEYEFTPNKPSDMADADFYAMMDSGNMAAVRNSLASVVEVVKKSNRMRDFILGYTSVLDLKSVREETSVKH